ncbi:hypothetical protein N9W95_02795, partial [Paracoccaceae bacterium]|nr:hypothetical protein [Paracoccaceae bacterium]
MPSLPSLLFVGVNLPSSWTNQLATSRRITFRRRSALGLIGAVKLFAVAGCQQTPEAQSSSSTS